MLTVLAADWALLLFRASIALLFGIVALAWPELTPIALVFLFSGYALVDGIAALIVAFGASGCPGFGSLLFEGLVRLGASVIALAASRHVALALPAFLAAWAGLSGVGEVAVAVVLRREMAGEWPLPIAGALSLLVAMFLMISRGGMPALVWLIGPYSILFGFALVALALRLRRLSREMAKA
jgi:uncharacterized membrane protein HdeD (DUF308 family)